MMNLLKIEIPARFHDFGLLLLRIAFGFFIFYGHGFGKLMRLIGSDEINFADPYGLGPVVSLTLVTFAEVVCAILLIVGLFTRAALIPLIVTVSTAFFFVHMNQEFGQKEKVLLFLFGFICLFITGPGKYSMDALLQKKKLN